MGKAARDQCDSKQCDLPWFKRIPLPCWQRFKAMSERLVFYWAMGGGPQKKKSHKDGDSVCLTFPTHLVPLESHPNWGKLGNSQRVSFWHILATAPKLATVGSLHTSGSVPFYLGLFGGRWRAGGWRETVREEVRVGPHGTGHGAATDDSQDSRRSEPDLRCFVSFTLFSLLLEGQFCFVLFFYNVIDCHVQVLISS